MTAFYSDGFQTHRYSFMPCIDPRVNVYQFGSLGSVMNVNYLKINNLFRILPKSGSLWITFSGLLSHFWITDFG